MIIAITKSRNRHELGLFIIGAINFEPYARLKKNTKLASDAPIVKETLSFPENCCDIDPIRTIVSR